MSAEVCTKGRQQEKRELNVSSESVEKGALNKMSFFLSFSSGLERCGLNTPSTSSMYCIFRSPFTRTYLSTAISIVGILFFLGRERVLFGMVI